MTWRDALNDRRHRLLFSGSIVSLFALIFFVPWFFQEIIGPRKGIRLDDWLLDALPAIDCSTPIFVLIYAGIILTLITNLNKPEGMISGIATYSLVTWFRMLTIYLTPLGAPASLISLTDPLLSVIAYPPTFTQDLFFSGHVSTMVVLFLMEPNPVLKYIKIAAAAAVSGMLLLQHIHYSMDVFFAPVFTWGMFWMVKRIRMPQTD